MPNHVCNRLRILDVDDETRKKILDAIALRDGKGKPVDCTIDFNRIIPMPSNIFQGNLGTRERELYGENNWYDWSRKNWGTKWNAYDFSEYSQDCGADLIFSTAWNTPEPIFVALGEMFPDVHFHVEFADEDLGFNCGEFDFKGDNFSYTDKGGGTEESYRFACDVWNYDYDDVLEMLKGCE